MLVYEIFLHTTFAEPTRTLYLCETSGLAQTADSIAPATIEGDPPAPSHINASSCSSSMTNTSAFKTPTTAGLRVAISGQALHA